MNEASLSSDKDPIAAIATAPGRGGIGIIRLSGTLARQIGETMARLSFTPRLAHFCQLHDDEGTVLDSGICLYFPAPHSFTGEDVVELQGHGGPVVMDMLLAACCAQGARLRLPECPEGQAIAGSAGHCHAQCNDTEATISQRVSPAPRRIPPVTMMIASAMT